MSDESNSKNVASIWILVVLVGGLSVPFWRWDDTRNRQAEPLQWVDPNTASDATATPAQSPTQHSLVSATTNSQQSAASQLLQEFANTDPGLQIQDAVKENQQRPGIPKQFQGEGIPLTDIKPWIPKPIGYDATPSDRQKLAGTVDGPIHAPASSGSSPADPNTLVQSTPPASRWPDAGFSGIAPNNSTTTYYRAEPTTNVAASEPTNTAIQNGTVIQNGQESGPPSSAGPGRMVSNSHSNPSDPPALSGGYSANPNATPPVPQNGNPVRVTPSPAITPPANPLRAGQNGPPSSRRPGTVISQPKPATGK